ncbi:hypothetical protein [Anaerofustis butyriciformans]|uniref:hypothetical protein n=1 Tax=Anaerofustis butyriciformans TaxID=3108533 RepID=UPI002E32523C|nr:hypothetical protein [Anaerofustis sp. HA2171]
MENVRLILFILSPILFSVVIGTGSYTDYLYKKYGEPVKGKYYNRNPKIEPPFIKRLFRIGWEDRYKKSAKRRNRFMYFLWLTRINYGVTIMLLIFTVICMIFKLVPNEILKYVILGKAIILDSICIISCLPFGFIFTLILADSRYPTDIWWG